MVIRFRKALNVCTLFVAVCSFVMPAWAQNGEQEGNRAQEAIAQIADPNALMLAIVTHNVSALSEELAKPDAPVNAASAEGVYPIHLAAAYADAAVMKQLIASDAKLDVADSKGRTAMHFLAMRGATEPMKLLLSFKPDLALIEDKDGFSALWVAYASDQLEAAAYLLGGQFDTVNRLDDNGTPLAFHFVRMYDKPAAIEHMLSNQLNVLRRNGRDQLLHDVARAAGHNQSAQLLEARYEQILQQYKQRLLQQQKGTGK